MGYAIELLLRDDEAAPLRAQIAAAGSVMAEIGTLPHVSLAVFEEADVTAVTGIVQRFATRTAPFTLHMSSISLFPGAENVVFLAPVVTAELLALHAALHQHLTAAGQVSDAYYRPGNWVPHCAITTEEPLDRSLATIQRLHAQALMRDYRVEAVNLVRFRPIIELARFPLCG